MRTRFAASLVAVALVGCAQAETQVVPQSGAGSFVLIGGTVVGLGHADVEIRDGVIHAIGAVDDTLPVVDVSGRFLAPAFVDSHVHLSYWPVADELAHHGVAAVVDLAAPMSALTSPPTALTVLSSGPMITAPGGYPTTSWGSDGYGAEVSTVAEARALTGTLADAGARLIKMPFGQGPLLGDDVVRAVVERAHERRMLVAAHALADEEARRAATLGVDILAHTPVEPLSDDTVALWAGRTVISTLAAFGGSAAAIDNLRRLHEAGAQILYGTDLGNRREARIDPMELELLAAAGLSASEILDAGTRVPCTRFTLAHLGAVEVGKEASLLVLERDPLLEPRTLATPAAVVHRGQLTPTR